MKAAKVKTGVKTGVKAAKFTTAVKTGVKAAEVKAATFKPAKVNASRVPDFSCNHKVIEKIEEDTFRYCRCKTELDGVIYLGPPYEGPYSFGTIDIPQHQANCCAR